MEKLPWFKFTPSNWMMGKIQRCPEVTQARFVRLCSLYWNKDCELSIEDAEIEIDKEHFDILVAKKIISKNETFFNIGFLDEQYLEIQELNKGKSKGGIIGNLKRWHLGIYNEYMNKKISLDEAIIKSKSIANLSHTDSIPIATQSQNIAEKRREEEIRKDNTTDSDKSEETNSTPKKLTNTETFEIFWDYFHKITGKPKEDKAGAFAKWKKMNLENQRKAYDRVHIFKKSVSDIKFLPIARTYLANERYNDDLIPEKPIKYDVFGNKKFDFGDY